MVLAPRGIFYKPLAFSLLTLLAFAPSQDDPHVKVSVLDVGQGLSTVIQVPGDTLVFDLGAKRPSGFNLASSVVLPYLYSEGVETVDLIVSHGDNDHAGGVEDFMQGINVRQLVVGQALESIDAAPCLAGQGMELGEFKLKFIWPDPAYLQHGSKFSKKSNNYSCVALMTVGQIKILMPGDIEKAVEALLIEKNVLPNDVDILIAPHHGSKTSSSTAFVNATSPRYVVFSAAYRGAYGHPHQEIVERYQREGAVAFNTGVDGAIVFELSADDQKINVFAARERFARLWYE